MKALALLSAALLTATLSAEEKPRKGIDLPDGFAASAETLTIQKRFLGRTPMKIGDLEVRDHSRGWKKTRAHSGPAAPWYVPDPVGVKTHSEKSSMRFNYSLYEDGAPAWVVNCEQRDQSESVDVRGVPVSASGSRDLACTLASPDAEQWEWTLEADAFGSLSSLRQTVGGKLESVDRSLTIDGINKAEGSNFRLPAPIGFTISENGKLLGAIEVLGKGTIFLAPDVAPSDRPLLTAALVGLMFGIDE